MQELALDNSSFEMRAVSPFIEMGAYEALWCRAGATFKALAQQFAQRSNSLPSDFVLPTEAREHADFVMKRFDKAQVRDFGVRVYGAGEYPNKLRDATHPVQLIYYQGWWDLVESRSVAVVGTRKATDQGLGRTRRLVRALVDDGFTIVSGLATGIDSEAHKTAIEANGRTIAVIGTPLSHSYPKENAELQRHIGENFLIISQVPVKRYENQDYRRNRAFFPERNVTMSALTEATIIVEAGDTSGALIQARAALKQNRKLFILDNCFRNPNVTWPAKFAQKGAVRVKDYDDIRQHLSSELY